MIRLREYLTVAATGKTVTRRSIKDVAKSAIHFEAAWDALCPIRDGRVAIVTLSALEKSEPLTLCTLNPSYCVILCHIFGRCLFGPVGLSPTDLRPTEVPQVLQVMVKGGPQKKDTAPSRSGVTFLEFCSFLSHDELIAGARVVCFAAC